MMQRKRQENGIRPGFSFLELQVAFVLLGIALGGLGPLVVIQARQLREIESRFDDQATYYLVPSDSAWARKLGAAATLESEDPGPPPSPTADDPACAVNILSIDRSLIGETVKVHVAVSPMAP